MDVARSIPGCDRDRASLIGRPRNHYPRLGLPTYAAFFRLRTCRQGLAIADETTGRRQRSRSLRIIGTYFDRVSQLGIANRFWKWCSWPHPAAQSSRPQTPRVMSPSPMKTAFTLTTLIAATITCALPPLSKDGCNGQGIRSSMLDRACFTLASEHWTEPPSSDGSA